MIVSYCTQNCHPIMLDLESCEHIDGIIQIGTDDVMTYDVFVMSPSSSRTELLMRGAFVVSMQNDDMGYVE